MSDRDPIDVMHQIHRQNEAAERRALASAPYNYVWRVKTMLADRKGQRCRVVNFPAVNCVEVEFEDGFRTTAHRNYIYKAE